MQYTHVCAQRVRVNISLARPIIGLLKCIKELLLAQNGLNVTILGDVKLNIDRTLSWMRLYRFFCGTIQVAGKCHWLKKIWSETTKQVYGFPEIFPYHTRASLGAGKIVNQFHSLRRWSVCCGCPVGGGASPVHRCSTTEVAPNILQQMSHIFLPAAASESLIGLRKLIK